VAGTAGNPRARERRADAAAVSCFGASGAGISSFHELADLQGISLPAMSSIIDGMVRRGLVASSPSRKDRRRIELNLTEKGKTIFAKLNDVILRKLTRLIDQIDVNEQAEFERGLVVWDRLLQF
jgi:DNA-binding MarR family transcriptional regulator